MQQIAFLFTIFCIIFISIIDERTADKRAEVIITGIIDNGCASKVSREVETRPLPTRIKSYKTENL